MPRLRMDDASAGAVERTPRFNNGDVVRSRRSGRFRLIVEDNEYGDPLAMVVPIHNSEMHQPMPIHVGNLYRPEEVPS